MDSRNRMSPVVGLVGLWKGLTEIWTNFLRFWSGSVARCWATWNGNSQTHVDTFGGPQKSLLQLVPLISYIYWEPFWNHISLKKKWKYTSRSVSWFRCTFLPNYSYMYIYIYWFGCIICIYIYICMYTYVQVYRMWFWIYRLEVANDLSIIYTSSIFIYSHVVS